MSKQFEQLSKNLASGMSRRMAFGRFAAGIGTAIAALALPRLASARDTPQDFCENYCRIHVKADSDDSLQACICDCERLLHVNGSNCEEP